MKKEVLLGILFDYYEDLLTERQKEYFTNYYFENFSLGEISENLNVSRNAVHKELKVIEEKLNNYENILHMYYKDRKLDEILEKISDEKIKKEILKIRDL